MDVIETEADDIKIFRLLPAKDPLADDGRSMNETYHRVDEKIFADPIPITTEVENSPNENSEEICFVDNIIVKKKAGKRDKYYIDIDCNSSNPVCPQTNCNKTFSTVTLLRAHIRKVHCADRKRFICDQCGVGFPAKYLLERHLTGHREEKTECPVCRQMLSKRTNMSVHLKWHSHTYEHKCPVCERAFLRRATLRAHMRRVHKAELT